MGFAGSAYQAPIKAVSPEGAQNGGRCLKMVALPR